MRGFEVEKREYLNSLFWGKYPHSGKKKMRRTFFVPWQISVTFILRLENTCLLF